MHTPFQKYLAESIKGYEIKPGFYYDPIRDQSIKDDGVEPKPEPKPKPKPDLGPRPEFDWEVNVVNTPSYFPGILLLLLFGEFTIPAGVMKILGRAFAFLPENVEDWQEYFDNIMDDNGLSGGLIVDWYITQIVEFLTEIVEDGIPMGEYDHPFVEGETITIDKPMTEYIQHHFNQYLQQLIDFLSDYEYGGGSAG